MIQIRESSNDQDSGWDCFSVSFTRNFIIDDQNADSCTRYG